MRRQGWSRVEREGEGPGSCTYSKYVFTDYLAHELLSGHSDSLSKYNIKVTFIRVPYCSFKSSMYRFTSALRSRTHPSCLAQLTDMRTGIPLFYCLLQRRIKWYVPNVYHANIQSFRTVRYECSNVDFYLLTVLINVG